MFGLERLAPARRLQARQRGVSIVEVMVGMVVSLLVGLAATGAAISFSASQRMGVGVGGGMVNVNTTLASVKSDITAGGLGFFGDDAFMCGRMNLSVGAVTLMDNQAFAPVRITRGAVNDQIDILFGSRVEAGANARLRAASTGALADLDNFLPVQVGDAVLLASAPGATTPQPCLFRTVTAVTAAVPPAPMRLTFANTGNHNAGIFATGTAYPSEARVALVGRLEWRRYRLVGTDLVVERPLVGDSTVIARNVMTFRAQYGVSSAAASSTTLESWEDASGATWANLSAASVRRVRALRLGLVVRSPIRDKADDLGQCEATSNLPTLFGQSVTPDVTDWTCYRFSTSTVTVPLRNVALGART